MKGNERWINGAMKGVVIFCVLDGPPKGRGTDQVNLANAAQYRRNNG